MSMDDPLPHFRFEVYAGRPIKSGAGLGLCNGLARSVDGAGHSEIYYVFLAVSWIMERTH